MSEENRKPISLEQYVGTLRNQIVLSYDSAKEVALKNFDDISNRFAQEYNANLAKKETQEKPIVTPDKPKTKRK
jgi:hypothetical protein